MPVSRAPADKKPLGAAIWGIAVFDLIERQLMTVTEVEKKTLFIKSKHLRAGVPAGVTVESETRHGLERDLLKVACLHRDDKDGIDVESLVSRVFGSNRPGPWAFTIAMAWEYAVRSGVGERHEQDVTWDAEKMAALEGQARTAWAAYQVWLEADPLTERISSQVRSAVATRSTGKGDDGDYEADDDGDDDGGDDD